MVNRINFGIPEEPEKTEPGTKRPPTAEELRPDFKNAVLLSIFEMGPKSDQEDMYSLADAIRTILTVRDQVAKAGDHYPITLTHARDWHVELVDEGLVKGMSCTCGADCPNVFYTLTVKGVVVADQALRKEMQDMATPELLQELAQSLEDQPAESLIQELKAILEELNNLKDELPEEAPPPPPTFFGGLGPLMNDGDPRLN